MFRLPAGRIQAAVGVEYRKDSLNDTPDIESQNGNLYGFTSSTITKGKDSVWEAFGEVEVPVLKDQLFHELTLNGSARYTHYKSYGGDWTYKVGGLFSPIKPITFRGVVRFRWVRDGRVVARAVEFTETGHRSTAGADPEGYSAATCSMSCTRIGRSSGTPAPFL